MRKTLLTLAVVGLIAGLSAGPAVAGPGVPSVPQDCNELNALIGINNVQDCDHS